MIISTLPHLSFYSCTSSQIRQSPISNTCPLLGLSWNSDFQWGSVLPPRGHLEISGDIFVMTGRGVGGRCLWHVTAQGTAKHCIVHRTALTTKNYPPKVSTALRLRNPGRRRKVTPFTSKVYYPVPTCYDPVLPSLPQPAWVPGAYVHCTTWKQPGCCGLDLVKDN